MDNIEIYSVNVSVWDNVTNDGRITIFYDSNIGGGAVRFGQEHDGTWKCYSENINKEFIMKLFDVFVDNMVCNTPQGLNSNEN